MDLRFASADAFEEALDTWTDSGTFIVVTSHPSCNIANERGAWTVMATDGNFSQRSIRLTAVPTSMGNVGRTCHVKYDHSGVEFWDAREVLGLSRRAEQDDTQVFPFEYQSTFGARLPLFPPPNASLVPASVQNALKNVDIQIACLDCGLTSNLSVGVDFEIDLGDTNCTPSPTQNCFALNRAAVNFTVEDIVLSAELELFIGAEYTLSTQFDVLKIPVGPSFKFGTVIEIGAFFGLGVALDLDIPASLNITYGSQLHALTGAFASLDLVDGNGNFDPAVNAGGWDNVSLSQIPFRVNSGELDVISTLALQPFVEVDFTILEVGATARITLDLPEVDVNASLHTTTVNRECNPIGDNDFESFKDAFTVGAGLELDIMASFVVDMGEFIGSDIPNTWNDTFFHHEFPLLPSKGANDTGCFVLNDDPTSTTGTVASGSTSVTGLPASSGTLLAAASAVPSWNIPKIQSYLSASGQLPSNVNYGQMAQATTVPSDIKAAVAKIKTSSSGSKSTPTNKSKSNAAGSWSVY
ncbi:hypothetical protein EW026_g6051 [Hermanssonia centrifuga]|uniref:Uncharacterized protein n=1 Tax=Hermanssonia centrifuga TaxID=98765 RepID=A0A4S4KC68_9APHY|nr:hypothetical protein EW026_g6051 [Hermanssonia centrifuga]